MPKFFMVGVNYRVVDSADEEGGDGRSGIFVHVERRTTDALGVEIWVPAVEVGRRRTTMDTQAFMALALGYLRLAEKAKALADPEVEMLKAALEKPIAPIRRARVYDGKTGSPIR